MNPTQSMKLLLRMNGSGREYLPLVRDSALLGGDQMVDYLSFVQSRMGGIFWNFVLPFMEWFHDIVSIMRWAYRVGHKTSQQSVFDFFVLFAYTRYHSWVHS